jgi:hypothetical protein
MADMPSTLVLIVCRVLFVGEPDENYKYTGWRPTEFDTSGGVMHCRRHQVELYDPAVDHGADPMPFTPMACMRSAMTLGPQFDVEHKDKPWRFWKAACPTPIYPDKDGDKQPDRDSSGHQLPPIDWQIPACPESRGVLVCESDTAI